MVDIFFFQYFSLNWKFTVKKDFKKLSFGTNKIFFLFAYRVIYFWNKLFNLIKNRNRVKKQLRLH